MDAAHRYIAIDLKSFYASQECVERGLDPMKANLVVADPSRTEKTICLAVTPALKAYGIPGRARLFEVAQRVREINAARLCAAPGRKFTGASCDADELRTDPSLALDYIVAPPRMAHYMECSAAIYQRYLRYVAPEDIHVYSIDEVFLNATPYLRLRGQTAREFARTILLDIMQATGITATAGIGTNLYLCKIAMDIVAKHTEPDASGVRIAELDELSYRRTLWGHRPLTDFWRVGRGYARKLEARGIFTMGDIARCSLEREDLLYRLFGVNAELLIDHAWGWEPCTISDIKAYRPSASSLGSGQVLQEPYPAEKARVIVREMTDLLALELVEKGLAASQLVLDVGYDRESLTGPKCSYTGPIVLDPYGRRLPKPAHGAVTFPQPTASAKQLLDAVTALYDRIVHPELPVRRLNVAAANLVPEWETPPATCDEQLDLFTDPDIAQQKQDELDREKRRQQAILDIRKKYGKNAILKGMNFREGATAIARNGQIGGHKA